MKRTGLLILLSLGFLALTALTGGEIQISGHVTSDKPEIAKCIMLVKVVAKKGNKVLAVGHDLLDTTGEYKLTIKSMPSQQSPVEIFVAGLGIDTMYIKSYPSFPTNNVTLNIPIPNVYTKDDAGNVVCPKCGSSADILPVKYGAHHRIKRIIHNGDTTYVPLDHNIPSEMYSELHPYWYCNKCKIQF
ncbi:MAG TPA: hypothetical protein VNY36_02230 [Bacteroidia bacterium]|jgi:hypothetical protein|nr:hypothetical protein [Bacteroidia bacterium]